MTLQQLEYIIALDTHRHFVTAAEHCFVTQPTLSMQVQKLEEEIGVKIFDRNQKPLLPTLAGEQIIVKARQILGEVQQLKDFVSFETESIEGSFTIGIIPTLAPFLLPLFLPSFCKKYPSTYLIIRELQTDEIIKSLQQNTIDMGFLATPLEIPKIREIPLFNEPFLLYLPNNHEWKDKKNIELNMLNPSEILLLEKGHCLREQTLALCGHLKEHYRNFEYQSGSIEALKGLVNQGIGYTLVPELSVLKEIDSHYIKRFNTPQPVREISLVVNHRFTKEVLIEKIYQHIQSVIPISFQKSKHFMRVKWR